MTDFALAALAAKVVFIVGAIWLWTRYGHRQDRWRVPLGGAVVAVVIVLVALLGEQLMGTQR
jgi:hypothetical protein